MHGATIKIIHFVLIECLNVLRYCIVAVFIIIIIIIIIIIFVLRTFKFGDEIAQLV